MATKGKEAAYWKEKTTTSPSKPQQGGTAQRKKSPSPSVKRSLDHTKLVATTSDKHIPNYLKPTISSSPELPVAGKKPASTIPQNPTINRRRSFDRPPSRIQKALISPTPGERNHRSAHKTPTLPKSQPERPLKTYREVGKSQSLSSRPAPAKKTTNTPIIKKQSINGSGKVATKNQSAKTTPNVAHAPKNESLPEHQESLVTEVEKEVVIKPKGNDEVPTETPTLEEKEHVELQVQPQLKNEEAKPRESSYTSEDQNAPLPDQMEKQVDRTHVEEKRDDNQNIEEDLHIEKECDARKGHVEEISLPSHDHGHDHDQDQPKGVESEHKAGENTTAVETSTGKTMDEKEEVVNHESQMLESAEIEKEEKAAKGAEAEPDIAEAESVEAKQQQQQQGEQGKKDSTAYNDVIEETACKLREERKNKVKALVGAFETVISLQEPEA